MEPPPTPIPKQSRLGCLTRLILVFLLVGAVMAGVTWLFAPWGYYMGGRFHWFPSWQGVGRLHSDKGGGDYAVYLYFYPRARKGTGLMHVEGTAMLCTPRGEKFNLTLGGDFEKTSGRDLNGKTASFYMNQRRVLGGDTRPSLELRGRWNNPDLVLDDHGSIARAFEPDGSLYTGHSPGRPYMREVVPVTLHEGSPSDFNAACVAVKTR